MHLPPPRPATIAFAQKLSEPPSCVNVQHLLAPDSVQSAVCLHRRTVCVPVQLVPRLVAHCAAGVQATVIGPVVQLGTVPPVTGMVPQQTAPGQSVVLAQAKPEPESPPELLVLPEPLPLVLPLPEPLLLPLLVLPLLVLPPLVLPLPLPLLPLLLLPLPLLPLPLLPLPLPLPPLDDPPLSGGDDAPLQAATRQAQARQPIVTRRSVMASPPVVTRHAQPGSSPRARASLNASQSREPPRPPRATAWGKHPGAPTPMLPKHSSDPPVSAVRSVNFERELSTWFEEILAPLAENEPRPRAPSAPEWPPEPPSARIPFLIY